MQKVIQKQTPDLLQDYKWQSPTLLLQIFNVTGEIKKFNSNSYYVLCTKSCVMTSKHENIKITDLFEVILVNVSQLS